MKTTGLLIPALALAAAAAWGADAKLAVYSDWNKYQIEERDAIEFELTMPELPAPAETLRLCWTLSDIDGKIAEDGEEAVVKSLPPYNRNIATPVPHEGYFLFRAELVDDRGVVYASGETTLARIVFQPLEFDPDGYFGVNAHNEWWDAEIIRHVGATMWRADTQWDMVEPREGEWDFRSMDALIDHLHGAGIEILANLCYNPPWLKPAPDQGTDRKLYHEYVRRMVERYGDRVSHWDLWNEPQYSWQGDKNDFAAMQLETYKLIKSMQPDAEIIFNGHPFEEELQGYTAEQLESLGWDMPMTALGMHPYNRPQGPDDNDFLAHMRHIHDWLTQHAPNAKLWISELGWPTSTDALGVSERLQASFMARAAIYGLASGCEKFLYYQAWSGDDPVYSEAQYGLLNGRRQPKPALAVFSFLARTLRPLHFERMLDLGGAASGALFSGADGGAIVAWATHDPVKLHYAAPQADARWFRADGSPRPEAPETGESLLDDLPLVIVGPGAAEWAQALEAAQLTLEQPVALTASTVTGDGLKLRLENRDKRELEVTATVQLPDGVRFLNPALRDRNPAELQFKLGRTPKELLLKLDAPTELRDGEVALTLSTTDSRREVTLPWRVFAGTYRPGYPIDGDAAKWNGVEPFSLERITDIAPADMQKEWRGTGDLSVVRAWWGWNDEGVILFAEVRDNRHCPADAELGMWGSDSIQLAVNAKSGIAPDFYDEYSAEVGVGLMADGTHACTYTGKGSAKALVTRDENAKLTTYDILVPWTLFGLEKAPEPGTVLGASFIVNDRDEVTRKWMQLSDGIGVRKQPVKFPRLRLTR